MEGCYEDEVPYKARHIMSAENRFRDIAGELMPKTQSNVCTHPKSEMTRQITLPLGGQQTYFFCPECNDQWQEIIEVPRGTNSK
jgi:hypothetical protein